MSKNTEENKEKLKEKLHYLGLNLEKIPKVLSEFEAFSFKVAKTYEDTGYKVYKYVPINDIEILLTPTGRLTDLNQKYKLAVPIKEYLDSKSDENIERFSTFLRMLNDMDIQKIEDIEKEQEKLKKTIPYEVKYANNYIWQIYYSDISNKYFMLVPTNETNNNAFFYLLKKQIECSKKRKKEYIFAPITHGEYTGSYLLQSQITDLEDYLWYFTKEWPNIYEVYDIKGKMTLKIVGSTKVYGDVRSNYVITIDSKEKAIEYYKLVKALFIFATGLPNDYVFETGISKSGQLEFIHEEKTKMEYEELPIFINEQIENKNILLKLEDKKIMEEQEKLQKLKKITEIKTEEFLQKQRQIATFLACKKSFFGKIKYYFGNRKRHMGTIESNKNKVKDEEIKETKKEQQNIQEIKENYTIEDLIEICTKLEARKKMVKNLIMDKKALELKEINISRKIKNANIYLNEIELHKKSIFEFWKFTNKDELPSLNEGEEEEGAEKEKIAKSFVYEEDIEDLGKKMDEIQRTKLSKNETDSILTIKYALSSSQILLNTKSDKLNEEQIMHLQKQLEELKNEYEKNIDKIEMKDFDIFGGLSDDKTKIKILNNEKHREIEKDKYKVLNITPNTELEVYIDNIRNNLRLVKEALCKINTPYEIPIYISEVSKLEQNLNIANLNSTEEIYKLAGKMQEETLNFYTLQVPKSAPLLYYTNIIYFDNFNHTLPVGMNVTTEVLINLQDYKLQKEKEKEFYINYQIDEYTNKIIQVNAVNYKLKRNIEHIL